MLFIMTGCGGGARAWSGTYRGKLDIVKPAGMEESVFTSLSFVRLTIKPDGTFYLISMSVPMEGTGQFSSQSANLNIETIMGQPIKMLGEADRLALKPIELRRINEKTLEARSPKIGQGEWLRLVLDLSESL